VQKRPVIFGGDCLQEPTNIHHGSWDVFALGSSVLHCVTNNRALLTYNRALLKYNRALLIYDRALWSR